MPLSHKGQLSHEDIDEQPELTLSTLADKILPFHARDLSFDFLSTPMSRPKETLKSFARAAAIEVKSNIKSAITVALVNVPLSISLALAGGASPSAGIVTAFWAGLIAALFGGSQHNIVGPTGALSGVLSAASFLYGPEILPTLAILSGFLCLVVWATKTDRYLLFLPSSVIHGFTLGVAFVIVGAQLNAAFGLAISGKPTFLGNISNVAQHIGLNPVQTVVALLLTFAQLAALFFLGRKWATIPWSIIIAAAGISLGAAAAHGLVPVPIVTLDQLYPKLVLQVVNIPDFKIEHFKTQSVWYASGGIAFVALLETLISARLAEEMTQVPFSSSREVFGIGLANLSAVFGGIPATAALARTALNVKSGATSRWSAVLNCIVVLVFGMVVFPAFRYIPMPTIAAILINVALKMVDYTHIAEMWRFDKWYFAVLTVCALICVLQDTMMAILAGALLSFIYLASKMSMGHTEIILFRGTTPLLALSSQRIDATRGAYMPVFPRAVPLNRPPSSITSPSLAREEESPVLRRRNSQDEEESQLSDVALVPHTTGDTVVYVISGYLTYLSATAHKSRFAKLGQLEPVKYVVISIQGLAFIDLDGLDGLRDIYHELSDLHHCRVAFCGIPLQFVLKPVESHPFFPELNKLHFATHLEAINYLHELPEEQEIRDDPPPVVELEEISNQ